MNSETNLDRTEIILQNYAKFKNFLAKRLADPVLAEDVLQQSLIKALESPAEILEEKSVLAWFYTILRNAVTDHFRSKTSAEKALSQFRPEETLLPADFEAGICECLYSLLPALKPNYADLIRQIDLEGKSPAEVANSLGLSRTNLDVRLFRARKALKKTLEKMCGACTEHACLQCSCKH